MVRVLHLWLGARFPIIHVPLSETPCNALLALILISL
jgi:hypothetical protein